MNHDDGRKKHNIKMSLKQKTLVMLAVLLFFFCTMFLISTLIIIKRAEDDFKKRTSETAVNNVTATINSTLVNYNYISRLIMVNDKVRIYLHADEADKNMRNDAQMAMYDILNMYSYIDSVYIFRKDDHYVTTGRGTYDIDINNPERKNIILARGSRVVSINGNGMIKKSNIKTLLTMSRAIYDIYTQKFLGILVMNISGNVFEESLTLQNTGGICILDNKGTVLCGDEEIGALYDKDYNSENIVYKRIMVDGEKTTLTGKLAVKPLVVLCRSIKGTEELPRDTIYALMLTLIAFILSGMVCAWFITVNIARPIRNLSTAMEHTRSSGWLKKLDAPMPNNEIGRLAESYNSMIEYLNELFDRLIRDEKNVQKAEMRVLQEQIKPHFLYNSLETISYMAVQENASKVHDALETLGSFYRNFLSKGNREIPLKRELRITQDYLALQKLRYGDIFEDEYDIDEDTVDFMIPKLILQPLVENSINHGVRLKGVKCVIRITTRMEEDGVYITVYDSGIGMSEDMIKKVLEACKEDDNKSSSGFGLRGTINRIRYYCDCDDVIKIRSETGEYTEVEIFIPIMRKTQS